MRIALKWTMPMIMVMVGVTVFAKTSNDVSLEIAELKSRLEALTKEQTELKKKPIVTYTKKHNTAGNVIVKVGGRIEINKRFECGYERGIYHEHKWDKWNGWHHSVCPKCSTKYYEWDDYKNQIPDSEVREARMDEIGKEIIALKSQITKLHKERVMLMRSENAKERESKGTGRKQAAKRKSADFAFKLDPNVEELMLPLVKDFNAGTIAASAVADRAVELVRSADTQSAKLALLGGAASYYAQGGEYDKAADAIATIMSEANETPPQTLNGIVSQIAANAPEKEATRLIAFQNAISKRAKAVDSLNALETKLKKSPGNPSLKRMHAELVAATGDWEAALKEFAALGGEVGKIAEEEANGSMIVADFWWEYAPAAAEAKDAIKEHASMLYRKALDYGELEGLKKNLAEKRIAEFPHILATIDVAPKVEYKFNYRLDDKGNAILTGKPCVSPEPVGELVVPDTIDGHNVTGIDGWAFESCVQMTSIKLPANLELPNSYCGWSCPGAIFAGCTALKRIDISTKNPNLATKDGVLYSKDFKSLISWPRGRSEITLAKQTTNIDGSAFSGWPHTTLKLPEGVETMGIVVFEHSPNLEVVEFPKSMKWLGVYAFKNCPNMKKVVFHGDNAPDAYVRNTRGRETLFSWGSDNIVVEVEKGSKDWNGKGSTDLPERWPLDGNGSRPIRYIE